MSNNSNTNKKPRMVLTSCNPPAWTQGQMETPKGVEDKGYWEAWVYTEEQQKRLGVDKYGQSIKIGGKAGLPPRWIRDKIEAPNGEKNMGTWKAAVYDEEQQKRLCVDELGNKL
jgi:hypothetical protein